MIKNTIQFIDLRGKTLIDLLRAYPDKAMEIINASKGMRGLASRIASKIALPYADKKSHKWLKFSYNPHLYEIESFAEILEVPGVFSLNVCYEWACTSGVYRTDETVSLLRVMDWPLPSIGKHVCVALQSSKAGEFYNVTWPGLSGVFNAMAPGRFSAALNLAPMREHQVGKLGDWIINRAMVAKESGLPPSHLLRRVFEQATSYEAAKKMLMETPIAVPAIFTLSGVSQGEGCIIERLEKKAEVIELGAGQQLSTSNHFNTALAQEGKGWRPREIDSAGRHKQGCAIHGYDLEVNHFDWLRAPIINQNTRLAIIADAATRRLVIQGFEGMATITELFNLPDESLQRREAV